MSWELHSKVLRIWAALISLTMTRSMMEPYGWEDPVDRTESHYTVVTMDLRQLRQGAVLDKLGTARIVQEHRGMSSRTNGTYTVYEHDVLCLGQFIDGIYRVDDWLGQQIQLRRKRAWASLTVAFSRFLCGMFSVTATQLLAAHLDWCPSRRLG